MKLLNLLIAATIPVLKVILMTAVGSFLALDRIGIIGEDARKHFNNVSFYLFGPALVATNLAKTITFKTMVMLWFMPLNILITFVVGSAFGWLLIKITRAPSHLRGLVLGCCATGNLGIMPLIIIPAVCKEKGTPFGAPDVCYSYGMTYASLSLAEVVPVTIWSHDNNSYRYVKFGAIYMWSYVYNLVRICSENSIKDAKDTVPINRANEEAKSREDATLPLGNGLASNDNADHRVLVLPSNTSDERVPLALKFKEPLKRIAGRINFRLLFAPSTVAAMIGFVVGVIPQIRKLMIGDSAPLRVIQDSAFLYGEGAIPVISLVLGGNLLRGLKESDIRSSIITGIILVRYALLPLFGILVVKGATYFGLIHADPLYRFVLLLQFALPPAMNIGTLTQLFGVGESECSVIMFWIYPLASISLTLWCVLFMWLVS